MDMLVDLDLDLFSERLCQSDSARRAPMTPDLDDPGAVGSAEPDPLVSAEPQCPQVGSVGPGSPHLADDPTLARGHATKPDDPPRALLAAAGILTATAVGLVRLTCLVFARRILVLPSLLRHALRLPAAQSDPLGSIA